MRSICAAILVACVSLPLSAQHTPVPADAFREHAAAYAAAINKRDAAAVAALFTADADQVFMDGPRVVGGDAIRDAGHAAFATWPATLKFTLAVTSARMLSPDVAIVETVATFSEGPMQSNRGTLIMVRQGGKWLAAALRVYPAAMAAR